MSGRSKFALEDRLRSGASFMGRTVLGFPDLHFFSLPITGALSAPFLFVLAFAFYDVPPSHQ